jgi:YHS domain-containing protein
MKSLLTLALLSCCLTVSGADKPSEAKPTDTAKDAPVKAYPLKVCIVSDNDLDSMGEQASFIYQGQTIKVCCKPCIAKFEKNPAKYLKKLEGK